MSGALCVTRRFILRRFPGASKIFALGEQRDRNSCARQGGQDYAFDDCRLAPCTFPVA